MELDDQETPQGAPAETDANTIHKTTEYFCCILILPYSRQEILQNVVNYGRLDEGSNNEVWKIGIENQTDVLPETNLVAIRRKKKLSSEDQHTIAKSYQDWYLRFTDVVMRHPSNRLQLELCTVEYSYVKFVAIAATHSDDNREEYFYILEQWNMTLRQFLQESHPRVLKVALVIKALELLITLNNSGILHGDYHAANLVIRFKHTKYEIATIDPEFMQVFQQGYLPRDLILFLFSLYNDGHLNQDGILVCLSPILSDLLRALSTWDKNIFADDLKNLIAIFVQSDKVPDATAHRINYAQNEYFLYGRHPMLMNSFISPELVLFELYEELQRLRESHTN